MKKNLLLFIAILSALSLRAQTTYSGDHQFDGVHKNEVAGYISAGSNSVADAFVGPSFFYTRHFTSRWSAQGAIDIPFGKDRYGISGKGTYRLPFKHFNLYFSGRFMYNRYQAYRTNEFVGNLQVALVSSYFHITVGESIIGYSLLGSSYNEPLTFTFGLGANLRPLSSSWNVGIFGRNFDDFFYENWNINWGLCGHVVVSKKLPLDLFGEFNIRPAGSTSQLATKYETSVKVGVKYVW